MKKHYRSNKASLPKKRLIIGRKPLIEALNAHKSIEKIFFLQGIQGPEVGIIRKLAQQENISISQVPAVRLGKMTSENHQGVVAISSLIAYQDVEEIIQLAFDEGRTPLIVLLDGITDIGNLGAIARSAYSFDADALLIPNSSNASITEQAVKSSAGALEHLPICRAASAETAIDILKMNGLKIMTTSLMGTQTLQDIQAKEPIALVIGSEDRGVGKYALKQADYLVKIKMSEQFDSLNASVSAGIALHHLYHLMNT